MLSDKNIRMEVQYLVEKKAKIIYYIEIKNESKDTLYILNCPSIDSYMSTWTEFGWRRMITIDWGWSGIVQYDLESGYYYSVIPFYPNETMRSIRKRDYPSDKIGEIWLGFNYLKTKPLYDDVDTVNGKEVYAVYYDDYRSKLNGAVYSVCPLHGCIKAPFDKEISYPHKYYSFPGPTILPLKMKDLQPIKQ